MRSLTFLLLPHLPLALSTSPPTTPFTSSSLLGDINSLRLSPNATVLFPTDPLFPVAVARWDPWSIPSIIVSIEAATVRDVQQVVNYVRRKKLPLLVRNTSHGFTATVAGVRGGVQLSVGGMDEVRVVKRGGKKGSESESVSESKKEEEIEKKDKGKEKETKYSIILGGGAKNAQLVETMFQAGLRTSTGGCDCVGVAGLALGGGHGKLQGLYGVVSDVIEEVEMVTADGKVRVINERSKGEEKDLWWAIRGAGHNFGVVTKMTLKAWEKVDDDMWVDATYLYEPSKLPDLITLLNTLPQPPTLTIFFGFLPSTSPQTQPPSIRLSLQYGGGPTNFPALMEPFLSLRPFSISNQTVPLNQIATATGIGTGMGFCLGGSVYRGHYSAQVKKLEVDAVTEAWRFYGDVVKEPEFQGTSIVWELYPQQRFKEIDGTQSAYPWREMDIISLFMINFRNPTLQPRAQQLGEAAREILHRGSGVPDLRVYVNYAQGDEGQEVWYGRGWRADKVSALKGRWDPEGVFNAYNPILVD
ncbi:FAD-binding domain-containing protein [Ascodesmis nigricans]|uniref:FAD-binding domain-containing protein n=1 Tax=Ascodesmis nigricans TaxID=341454 RepID=A0A4S2MSB8_9PEZI|nr:FAD-binding domain-containing protein [Ascodesmis nigricans]